MTSGAKAQQSLFSFLFLFLFFVVSKVDHVVGSCCVANDYPRDGQEYFDRYGVANVEGITLCFDGGGTTCYAIQPVTLAARLEYLSVNPTTNQGQYNKHYNYPTSSVTTSFAKIRLSLSNIIEVVIDDYAYATSEIVNGPLLHFASNAVVLVALGTGYSCLTGNVGVGQLDLTGTSLVLDQTNTVFQANTDGGTIGGSCIVTSSTRFTCSGGGFCGGRGPAISGQPPIDWASFYKNLNNVFPPGSNVRIRLEATVPYPTLTATPSRTRTRTKTRSASPSRSRTRSATRSRTATRTVSPTSSRTPTFSPTRSVSGTASSTVSISPSISLSPSITPSRSLSGSITASGSSSPSVTPTSETRTVTPTVSSTASVSASSSATGSVSATRTPSSSSTPSGSLSASSTLSPSITNSQSLSASFCPSPSPTLSMTTSLLDAPSPSISSSVVQSAVPASEPLTPPPTYLSTSTASRSRQSSRSRTPSDTAPPTRTPTPTSVVVIGPSSKCSSTKMACPDGACVSSIANCDSQVSYVKKEDGAVEIDSVKYEVKKGGQDEKLVVVVSSGGASVGTVSVPPNTLKAGWTLKISSSSKKQQENSKQEKCGSGKETYELRTAAWDITVEDRDGNEVPIRDLPNGIRLSSFVELSGDLSASKPDLCFGFSEKEDDKWKCLQETKLTETKRKGVYIVESETDHLTSFSVFFNFGDSNCNKVLWIVSVSLIGFCFVSALLLAYFSRRFYFLRSLIGGYHKSAKELDAIEAEIARRSAMR